MRRGTQLLVVLVLLFVVFLMGCPNKYTVARMAVVSGRAATGVVNVGMLEFEQEKRAECLQKCPNDQACFDGCFKDISKALEQWKKSKIIANASWDLADESIRLAEADNKNQVTVDMYMAIIKRAACVIAEALVFLPEKWKVKVQLYLSMMKGFGCTK